jgi:hypothetical protein
MATEGLAPILVDTEGLDPAQHGLDETGLVDLVVVAHKGPLVGT